MLSFNPQLKPCSTYISGVLKRTAHITRATVVARAIGFCYFNARLTGGLGVTGTVLKEGLPGKGQDLHRIMALAATDYCNDWNVGNIKKLDSYIEQAIGELESAGILEIQKDEELQTLRNESLSLLKHFASILPKIKDFFKLENIKCLPEVQIIDFETKIWGVPDLIIEDARQRKGIVVEWKSYTDIREADVVQSFIYSILEAMRLGYTDLTSLENAIAPDDVSDTKVANLVIRPNGPYSKHIALGSILTSKINYYDQDYIRRLIKAIIVMAHHLTVLVTDPGVYVGDRRAVERVCSIEKNIGNRTVKIQVHRYGPREIFGIEVKRGSPMGNHDKYPCKICPYSDKNSPIASTLGFGECKLYFGKLPGEEKTTLEKLIWKFRFNVYKQSERSMLLYKGLYYGSLLHGGIEEFIKQIKDTPIEVGEKGDLTFFDKRSTCFNLHVNYSDSLKHEAKAIVDIYKIKHIFTNTEGIIISKPKREVEMSGEVSTLCLPREKKPVLVAFLEPHVSAVTHAAGLFARVSYVAMPGEEIGQIKCDNDEVCLLITPISPHLRFPFHLFLRYHTSLGIDKVVVSEVDADLTYIDLRTLHALQAKAEQAKLDQQQREYLSKFLVNALQTISQGRNIAKT